MGKKYAEYTVDDLVRLDLSFLIKDKPEEEIVAQRDAFIYLKQTARSCKMDISQWKLLEMFGDGTSNNMVTDKAKINEILFSKLSEAKELDASKGLGYSLLEESKGKILDLTKKDYDSDISRIKRDLVSRSRKLRISQSKVQEHITVARGYQERIDDLENKKLHGLVDDSVYKTIQQILANGYWQFIGIEKTDSNEKVMFATTEYVKQSLVNPAAGIDIHVEYGIYYVEIDLKERKIKCYPYADAIQKYHPHPHVSKSGNICWGNYDSTVGDHMVNDEWKEIMDLLQVLLTTYCGDNPYTSIESLHGYYKTLIVGPTTPPTPENVIDHYFSPDIDSDERTSRIITKAQRINISKFPLHVTPKREVPLHINSEHKVMDSTHEDYPFLDDYKLGDSGNYMPGIFIWDTRNPRMYMTTRNSLGNTTVEVLPITRAGRNEPMSLGIVRDFDSTSRYKVIKNTATAMKALECLFRADSDSSSNTHLAFERFGIFVGCTIADMAANGEIRRPGNIYHANGTMRRTLRQSWNFHTAYHGYGSTTRLRKDIAPLPLFRETLEEYSARLDKWFSQGSFAFDTEAAKTKLLEFYTSEPERVEIATPQPAFSTEWLPSYTEDGSWDNEDNEDYGL